MSPLQPLLPLLPLLQPCSSHGGLAFPPPWQDLEPQGWKARTGSRWGHIGRNSVPDMARMPGKSWPSGQIWNWFNNATAVPNLSPSLADRFYHLDALPARACDEHGSLVHDKVDFAENPDTPATSPTGAHLCGWIRNRTAAPDWIMGKKLWRKPWMVPGSAPLFSPCGINGGNPEGCPAGKDNRSRTDFNSCGKGVAWAFGQPATSYSWPEAATTKWRVGSVQDTVWWLGQAHGGGYSYRLCRLPAEGLSGLTEDCFQQTPLRFVGDMQWYNDDQSSEWQEGRAVRTDEGTHPTGSQWTMVRSYPARVQKYATRDRVKVPHVEPGDYVLSFRWDCERTSQVWSGCANIKVTRPARGKNSRRPRSRKEQKDLSLKARV